MMRKADATMGQATKYFTLSFPQQLIKEPIIFNIGSKFGVQFNILRANVTESQGHLTVCLSAEDTALTSALDYLRLRGVKIEEIPAPVNV